MGPKSNLPVSKNGPSQPAPKKFSLAEIQKMEKDREDRRKKMGEKRDDRAAEVQRQKDCGIIGDVDFNRMIRDYREKCAKEEPHGAPGEMKICVCVRKRPTNAKEIKAQDHDAVTCLNPTVVVHDCKLKVDGLTKYLDNVTFEMDHTFHETDTTDDLYYYSVQPLVPFVVQQQGRATVFAYGQTGSGKTYTMIAIQKYFADDLFQMIAALELDVQVCVSFYEIYGGRCQDLLNDRHRLNVLEDGKGEVVIAELVEKEVNGVDELSRLMDIGNSNRTTHATEMNNVSSRSHAICTITLKNPQGKLVGKLSLIDLAGSERGSDTKSHNRQLRMEGAEINKSLLALK
eukprot:gene11005-22991_t